MNADYAYQALLIDLDGTLVDYARTEAAALASTYGAFFRNHADFPGFVAAFKAGNDELWASYRRQEIGLDTLRVERFGRLLTRFGVPQAAADIATVVLRFEDELARRVSLFADSLAALRVLRSTARLVLVTDGIAAVQRAKLARTRLRRFFEYVVISSEVGYRKPDPALLRHALARVGTDRTAALMVGDCLASDGAAAHAAGVDFCWVNRDGRVKRGVLPGPAPATASPAAGAAGTAPAGPLPGRPPGAAIRFQVPDLAALASRLAGTISRPGSTPVGGAGSSWDATPAAGDPMG